ncbi:MAG: ImmA/IrrE family metallo-endopeptidase [Nitrososphaera sp.]|nr:ImmA/IrrE family metallo-endopeptidase [Nitrososphaera sp.]
MHISPEFAAKHLLLELKVKSPEDLRDLEVLAYCRGVLVRYARLDGAEARLSVVGSRAIITISNAVTNLHRRRFGIAHELGHLEMHRDDSGIAICTGGDLNEWIKSNRVLEQEANKFAAAFLLPQPFFEPLCNQEDPSLDFVSQLANRFRVSLTATALRYVRFCSEPVAIVYSHEGRIQWFSGSTAFQDLNVHIETKVRLDPLSSASRVTGSQGYQSPRRVPASAWFAKGQYDDSAQIVEHSWHLESYDAVLTLLWVDDDVAGGDGFMWEL